MSRAGQCMLNLDCFFNSDIVSIPFQIINIYPRHILLNPAQTSSYPVMSFQIGRLQFMIILAGAISAWK